MNDKLKPCPFCGREVKLEEIPPNPFWGDYITSYSIGCEQCNVGWYKNTKDEAVKAWNTRTNGWIHIGERMPEQCGMSVLLVGVNGYGQTRVFQGFTGYMERGTLNFFSNTRDVKIENWDITHWMPLPEPPKENKP